ncbi:hypothetical protein ATANTOWER_017218 [Ataeniobius toweri]|uniref:Uncharacterized protein n=1 Tax=Ataeniobius toweri TaxID=208326 RepID=A0ABU7B9I4_9TELE|nr:hypothetical protein [Ataeniobius toweri]
MSVISLSDHRHRSEAALWPLWRACAIPLMNRVPEVCDIVRMMGVEEPVCKSFPDSRVCVCINSLAHGGIETLVWVCTNKGHLSFTVLLCKPQSAVRFYPRGFSQWRTVLEVGHQILYSNP